MKTAFLCLFIFSVLLVLVQGQPTLPTNFPTFSPTIFPTFSPTNFPTFSPTSSPTLQPTEPPTFPVPTVSPTNLPSDSPTLNPTIFPTQSPTTKSPTKSPTNSPTHAPTKSPSNFPTKSPTKLPTKFPTVSPTRAPVDAPTKSPTNLPTKSPTKNPTKSPTKSPTKAPTRTPTKTPTKFPTKSPTTFPTKSPTKFPTKSPTAFPTTSPTKNPTKSPTNFPTLSPTKKPTVSPTTFPTGSPSISPTSSPTRSPLPPTQAAASGSPIIGMVGGIIGALVAVLLAALVAYTYRSKLLSSGEVGAPKPVDEYKKELGILDNSSVKPERTVSSTSGGTEPTEQPTKPITKIEVSSSKKSNGVTTASTVDLVGKGMQSETGLIEPGKMSNVKFLMAKADKTAASNLKAAQTKLTKSSTDPTSNPSNARQYIPQNDPNAVVAPLVLSSGNKKAKTLSSPSNAAEKAAQDEADFENLFKNNGKKIAKNDDDDKNMADFEKVIAAGVAKGKAGSRKSPPHESTKHGVVGKETTENPSFASGRPNAEYIASAEAARHRSIFAPSDEFIKQATGKNPGEKDSVVADEVAAARPTSTYLKEAEETAARKSIFRPSSLFLSNAKREKQGQKAEEKKVVKKHGGKNGSGNNNIDDEI